MSDKAKSEPVQLSDEDNVRIAKLVGEATAGLEEVAGIVSQALGLEPKLPIGEMVLTNDLIASQKVDI